jgi:hypothetical protein
VLTGVWSDAYRTEPEHGRTIPRSAPACGYRVAVASAARMASSPAGWPFSVEYGPYGVAHTGVPAACRQLSASGPASTTLYPRDSMNSVTAAFAGDRQAGAAGRPRRAGE